MLNKCAIIVLMIVFQFPSLVSSFPNPSICLVMANWWITLLSGDFKHILSIDRLVELGPIHGWSGHLLSRNICISQRDCLGIVRI